MRPSPVVDGGLRKEDDADRVGERARAAGEIRSTSWHAVSCKASPKGCTLPRSGIDAAKVIEAISGGAAQSWQMENPLGRRWSRDISSRLCRRTDAQGFCDIHAWKGRARDGSRACRLTAKNPGSTMMYCDVQHGAGAPGIRGT